VKKVMIRFGSSNPNEEVGDREREMVIAAARDSKSTLLAEHHLVLAAFAQLGSVVKNPFLRIASSLFLCREV
jgi:hypothetical protein